MGVRRLASLVALTAAGLAVAASGCGEKEFDADEFVEEANSNGATLELGRPLVTDDESKELFGVTLGPVSAAEAEAGAEGQEPDAGSLAVYDDGDDAERGVQECEAAADLLCYRAGNVVIVLEGSAVSAEQVALAAALKEMAE